MPLILAACSVGPDYHAPTQPMPTGWDSPPTTRASMAVQQPVEIERWWTTFNDPVLDSLIRRAVQTNLDLEAAAERIRQARAVLGVVRAGFWPNVTGNGSFTRSSSDNAPAANNWQGALDSSWEIDIFGGVRRSIEAAHAGVEAAVEDRRDVMVTLLGEVATDYIQLRGQQQEVIIARENLNVEVRNAALTRDKKTLGTGTELDIAQADAQVASTTASLFGLEAQEQQTIYALCLLLALPPTALDAELRPPGPIPNPPAVVAVGIPSDLLRRRPDIRRAERQLAAATAQIGVATADLFPKFFLSGAAGIQGSHFGSLGILADNFWSVGPSVSWTLFDAGAITSNIDIQKSLRAQAWISYRLTVLTALQEVQNGLIACAREQERRQALARAVDLNQRAVVLSTHRYKQGLTDFLSVLVAEQSLFASQDALVLSNSAVGTDTVAIYKALGGGWEIDPDATTRPALNQ